MLQNHIPAAPLSETHVLDVDGNQKQVADRPAIGRARIGATLGWQSDAVRFRVVGGELGRRQTARDGYGVVVTTQQHILPKKKSWTRECVSIEPGKYARSTLQV